MSYVPDRGDAVLMDLDPQAGREQAGHRPTLVLSPQAFNRRTGLVIACPITSRNRHHDFEIPLPDHLDVKGVILTHHVKSLDWRVRSVKFMARIPEHVVNDVSKVIRSLLP